MKKEPNPPDWKAYKKLNKKDREKALARMNKETERLKTGERRDQVGGSSGSGIPRDAAGRAIAAAGPAGAGVWGDGAAFARDPGRAGASGSGSRRDAAGRAI